MKLLTILLLLCASCGVAPSNEQAQTIVTPSAGPATSVTLIANIFYRPTRRHDATYLVTKPGTTVIPKDIAVTTGSSGINQVVDLYFDNLNCIYKSNGSVYTFDHCIASSLPYGSILNVSQRIALSVEGGNTCYDSTVVRVSLELN